MFGHGENSVTFKLFQSLDEHRLFLLLNENVTWEQGARATIREKDLKEVHLFPCFGKRTGYGEPDAIILAAGKMIVVEVELKNLCAGKMPDAYVRQSKKFINLMKDISRSEVMRLSGKKPFSGETGGRFYGPKRLRSLYRKLGKGSDVVQELYYLTISNSSSSENALTLIREAIGEGEAVGIKLGHISFAKIKGMKKMSDTVKTINFNLSE